MKKIYNLNFIILALFLFPIFISAQDNFNWEGKWEAKGNSENFCNIHIVTNLIEGQEPTAILEGLLNKKPFRVQCRIESIPQRNSITLHELPDAEGNRQYEAGRPLLVLTVQKVQGQLNPIPVWMQVDVTGNGILKADLKKVSAPRLGGKYTLDYNDTKTALQITKSKKTTFHAKLDQESTDLECECKLQTTHLAVCYPDNDKGAFFLDFNEDGVKLVQNYDDDTYNTKLVGDMVVNATFKK